MIEIIIFVLTQKPDKESNDDGTRNESLFSGGFRPGAYNHRRNLAILRMARPSLHPPQQQDSSDYWDARRLPYPRDVTDIQKSLAELTLYLRQGTPKW